MNYTYGYGYKLYSFSRILGIGEAKKKRKKNWTMHHDTHCPLHIYHDGHELNVNQLIFVSQTVQPKFELKLYNDIGESREFVFQPNLELLKTSAKV